MKGLFIYQKGSISDYLDNELERTKEYLKKIGIATVAYGREYQAPQMVLIPDDNEKDAEISRLTAENAELRARLEKAVELQFSNGDEVYAIMDTLLYTGVIPVTIKSAYVVYEVFDGEQITTQHRTRIFATRAEAEARLKELQGGER